MTTSTSNHNCLQIEGHTFNVTWDKIPSVLWFVSVDLPYALTTRKGQLAINPLSGRVLAWRFTDSERGLVTDWSCWELNKGILITIQGPETGSYSWTATYNTKNPDLDIQLEFYARYGDGWVRTYDDDLLCTWEGLLEQVEVDRAENIRVMVPEKTWRS